MRLVAIDFDFPNLEDKVRRAEDEINLFIAAQIQTNRGMLFDSEGGYNGHERWAPLKLRSGQILSRSGALRQSIAPQNATGRAGPDGIVRFEGDTITVGTTKAYARLMNDGTVNLPGGVLRPVNAQALMIPLPSGVTASPSAKKLRKESTKVEGPGGRPQNVIFRKSVKIPARPFDNWTAEDEAELSEALAVKVSEVLNRG